MLQGFERVDQNRDRVYIRPECKPWLSDDLFSDFAGIRLNDIRPLVGRTLHFAYQPSGAPRRVIVRRPVRGGLVRFLGQNFAGWSRLVGEIRLIDQARSRGISVPELLAFKISPGPLFFKRLTVVYYEIPGVRNLDRALLEAPDRRPILESAAQAVRRLHDAGILHRDLNLRNILVTPQGISFVDLDRARICSGPFVSDVTRLNRSSVKLLGNRLNARERMIFLRSYETDRVRRRSIARACARNLMWHRLWWAILPIKIEALDEQRSR